MLAGYAKCTIRAFERGFKKKAKSEAEREGGEVVGDPIPYRVDGEVGRITFSCHHVMRQGAVAVDTSRQVFSSLIGKQWYQTVGFKEVAICHGVLGKSYRKARQLLNRIRHQPNATPLRTLQDTIQAEGLAASTALQDEAKRVVRESAIDPETLTPIEPRMACMAQCLEPSLVDAALREIAPDEQTLQVMRANPIGYEEPRVSVNVSIDDVLTKKQKEHRARQAPTVPELPAARDSKGQDDDQKKNVHTTVAHVQTQAGRRLFASAGVLSTCLLVVAFLAANGLLGSNLMFFVDGQRSLQDTLLRLFAWQGTLQLILDWHHLDKKFQEGLSLALNSRHVRNNMLKKLLHLLWYGNIDGAIACLRDIDPKHVKAPEAIDKLVGYLDRNRQNIPCYAVRKKLGLRNSSNQGEKANDLLVSARQKRNGMSWSVTGSTALSSLQALVCNDNHEQWFETRTVEFRQAA